MPRARQNFISGTIDDNPLTDSATTLNSSELAGLQAISAPSYAVLVLDPTGTPEIVYVTAHTASATSATITRGREGTSGVEHVQDVRWIHAPTAADFATDPAQVVTKYKASDQSATSDTSLNDDNDLLFAAAINEVWAVEIVCFYQGVNAGDILNVVDAPTGATIRYSHHALVSTSTAVSGDLYAASFSEAGGSASGIVGAGAGATTATMLTFKATVFMGGTAGDIKYRWCQGTSSGTATTVLAGSYLKAFRLSGA